MVIQEVDGKSAVWSAALEHLQLRILPSDQPRKSSVGWWWLVFDNGAPVAFAGLAAALTTPGTGYLCRAGVLPEYRGKGLQLRLIRVRERKAKKLGMSRIVTDTFQNPASSNTLIRAGYRMFNPAYKWGLDGCCYWQKDIA